jgi:hypothetical protein
MRRGQFDHLEGRGALRYSGELPESPLWAAREVLITDHDQDSFARHQQPDGGSTRPADNDGSAQLSTTSEPCPTIMKIADVFSITGNGTLVVGKLEHDVHVGDSVEVVGLGPTVIDGISVSRKLVSGAAAGEEAGLLLNGIARKQVERGAQIASV